MFVSGHGFFEFEHHIVCQYERALILKELPQN